MSGIAVTWRYLPKGQVNHALMPGALADTRARALCGVGWWNGPDHWSKPVDLDVIVEQAPLRPCRRCLAVLAVESEGHWHRDDRPGDRHYRPHRARLVVDLPAR